MDYRWTHCGVIVECLLCRWIAILCVGISLSNCSMAVVIARAAVIITLLRRRRLVSDRRGREETAVGQIRVELLRYACCGHHGGRLSHLSQRMVFGALSEPFLLQQRRLEKDPSWNFD